MSLIKNMLLIALSSMLGFIVIEVGIRYLYVNGVTPQSKIIHEYGNNYGHNCVYGWCPNPGQYPASKKFLDGSTIYDVIYSIGPERTRTINIDKQIKKNTNIKVNFFGGSYMFGEGLNDNETIPYYFTKLIPSAEVMNYGFHGYGAHNALRLLELKKPENSNVNVLLTGDYHADRSSCLPAYARTHPSYKLSQSLSRKVEYIAQCRNSDLSYLDKINNNYFDKLYDNYLSKLQIFKLMLEPLRNIFTLDQLKLYTFILKDFVTLSENNESVPIIMYLKEKYPNGLLLKNTSNKYVVEFLEKEKINWVDVTLGKDVRSVDKSLYLHKADKHPSALANCLRAKILTSKLLSNGIINKKVVDNNFKCKSIL